MSKLRSSFNRSHCVYVPSNVRAVTAWGNPLPWGYASEKGLRQRERAQYKQLVKRRSK